MKIDGDGDGVGWKEDERLWDKREAESARRLENDRPKRKWVLSKLVSWKKRTLTLLIATNKTVGLVE